MDARGRVHRVDGTKERRGSWEHNSGAEKTQDDLISMLIFPPPQAPRVLLTAARRSSISERRLSSPRDSFCDLGLAG